MIGGQLPEDTDLLTAGNQSHKPQMNLRLRVVNLWEGAEDNKKDEKRKVI
jgi:hypothetical protein